MQVDATLGLRASIHPPLAEKFIDLSRLPTSGFDVVGRDEKLRFLDEAFDNTTLNVVSLAPGVGSASRHW